MRGKRLFLAAVLFALALGLYAHTLAPTVTFVDSGELTVAAWSLGVAHPPGFPLYVLLAHLATLLPVGSVAERVNAFSAFWAAVAVALLGLVTAEILSSDSIESAPRSTRRRSEARKERKGAPPESAPVWMPALVAGTLFAVSRTLWSYATIAEVYTLNTALALCVWWLMFRWRREALEAASGEEPTSDVRLYAAAFVFGLALGVHHVTIGLMLPALAALVYATAGGGFFASRRLAYAALAAVAGASIYLYLPLAASRSPLLDWGDPRTLQRFWWHITGRQYQAFLSLSAGGMAAQARDFGAIVLREFGLRWLPAGLALAAAGLVYLRRHDRSAFWFLVLIAAADLAYGLNYDIAEDKPAYYLLTFAVLAVASGAGARWLLVRATRFRPRLAPASSAALLLVPALALFANFRVDDRSRYFLARDYVDNILSTVEPHGMLLTLDWQVWSPMLYARRVEGERPDVVVIDVNLLRRSWYFAYLRREYPQLMARAGPEVGAFLEDLRHWEEDPGLYQSDLSLNRRIDERFRAMILAFVRVHLASGPAYATEELALSRDPENGGVARDLTTAYQLVPQGLVFQLVGDRKFHPLAEPLLRTRGLVDGTLVFPEGDVVRLKVLPVYSRMLYNRGRYLALHGDRDGAAKAFVQSLAIDPRFIPAREALERTRRAGAK